MKKITLTQLVFGTAFLLTMLTPIVGSAQIIVEEFITDVQPISSMPPDPANPGQGFQFNLGSIDIDEDELLVVAVAFEGPSSSIEILGQEIDPISTSAAASISGIRTAIFVSDEVSGSIDLTFSTDAIVNFPGFYAASLSGAGGVETFGSFTSTERSSVHDFDLTGVGEGSFVLGAYADQFGNNPNVNVSGDLAEVQDFNGAGNVIGSAVGAVATGFGTGSDLGVRFSDASSFSQNSDPDFNRSSFSFVSIAPASAAVPEPGSVIVLALAGLAATTRRRRQ